MTTERLSFLYLIKMRKSKQYLVFAVVKIGFKLTLTSPSAIFAILVTSLSSLLVFLLSVWQDSWGR
jgi:hypothetical protein